MYNKNEKNYLSNGDLLDEKEKVHQSKKSKFFEKIKIYFKNLFKFKCDYVDCDN